MNRSYRCFFKLFESLLEAIAHLIRRSGSGAIELLPQPYLQFAGRFVRERDSDDAVDRGEALREHLDNAGYQLRGLAGARRRFNDQALIQRFANAVARGGITL